MKARSLLGRVTTLADVGNAAAFLASDRAGATTGTVFNLTSGTVVDQRGSQYARECACLFDNFH
jgi:enoyl-[acyl-carrier-protein] reductase (NADH)